MNGSADFEVEIASEERVEVGGARGAPPKSSVTAEPHATPLAPSGATGDVKPKPAPTPAPSPKPDRPDKPEKPEPPGSPKNDS
jgi:hypothetical protein